MKLGYSNLTGELIDAFLITSGDCAPFQIVCPACREPVFKVERDEGLHYLAHYRDNPLVPSDCELRVRAFGTQEVHDVCARAQAQRLKYFLEVLRDAVWKTIEPRSEPTSSARGLLKRFQKSKFLGELRDLSREVLSSTGAPEQFDGMARFYLQESGEQLTTALGQATHLRIARDIYRTLLTLPQRANFDFVWCAAYLEFGARQSAASQVRKLEAFEVRMRQAHDMFARLPRHYSRSLFEQMRHERVPEAFRGDCETLAFRFLSEIAHEMIGVITRVDYLALLRALPPGRFTGLAPTAGAALA